jgi:polyisoprenoid-binding protein YceI
MTRSILFAIAAVSLAASPAFAKPTAWEIDSSHSSVTFSVRHMMVSNVKGEFGKITGNVSYDADKPETSTIDATVDATTINTRDAKRDGHLKSPDFFDTAKFPTLTFKSKKITKAASGLKLAGDLTMHGVTKEVVFDVTGPAPAIKDPYGLTRSGATATAKINRKDFGLGWNKVLEAGGLAVGEEVAITLDLEMTQKAPATASAAPAAAPAKK